MIEIRAVNPEDAERLTDIQLSFLYMLIWKEDGLAAVVHFMPLSRKDLKIRESKIFMPALPCHPKRQMSILLLTA